MRLPVTKQKLKIIFFVSVIFVIVSISFILFPKERFELEFIEEIEEGFNGSIETRVRLPEESIIGPSFLNTVRDVIQVPFKFNEYKLCIKNEGYIREIESERIIFPQINVTLGGESYLIEHETEICKRIEIDKEYKWDSEFKGYFINFPGLTPLTELNNDLDFSHYRLSLFAETEKNELWGKRILTWISLYALLWLLSRLIYLFFDFDIWRDLKFKNERKEKK